jgi:hypothetical protein
VAKTIKRKILAVTVDLKLQLYAEKHSLKRDLIPARFANPSSICQAIDDKRADAAAKEVVRSPTRTEPSTKRSSNRKERWDKAAPTLGNVYDSNPEVDSILRSHLPASRAKLTASRKLKHLVNS